MNDGQCEHGIEIREPCLLCGRKLAEPTTVAATATRDAELPTTFDDDVELLVRLVEKAEIWITAVDLIRWLRAEADGDEFETRRFTRTYLRHMAKGSRGLVISGQRGYKATRKANVEEVQETAFGYMKAASGLMDRRRDILFAFHNGRAPTESERKRDAEQTD